MEKLLLTNADAAFPNILFNLRYLIMQENLNSIKSNTSFRPPEARQLIPFEALSFRILLFLSAINVKPPSR